MNAAVRDGVSNNFFFSTGKLSSLEPGKSYRHVLKNDEQTVFDLSSMTKALVCAPVVFRYLREKNLPIDTSLGLAFPKACQELSLIDRLPQMKIQQVLNHEAGFRPWKNFFVDQINDMNPIQRFLRDQKSLLKVGFANQYSDIGHILLTILLETELSRPVYSLYSDLVETEFGQMPKNLQLGSAKTFKRSEVASTGYCQVRGRVVRGEVHDENCSAFGGFTLHSGLFGTGDGVEKFLKQLFNSNFGKNFTRQLISQSKDVNTTDSCFGWRTGRDSVTKEFFGGDCVGHYGFTGCAFWINLKLQTFVILLTDRVSINRVENLPQLKQVRQFCFSRATKLSQIPSNE